MILFSIVLLFSITLAFASTKLDNRPVIGVLTQPSGSSTRRYGKSYIAASYIKYVEAGGARAVPVFHNSTITQLDWYYANLNGILFPGGGSDLSPNTDLFKAGKYFVERAVADAQSGDPFVVMGHCMGFELINLIVGADPTLLTPFDSENITMALDATPTANQSRLFSAAPPNIVKLLTTEPVTFNNHMYGVAVDKYGLGGGGHGNVNKRLVSFFDVISTNAGRLQRRFVSTIEAKNAEVYALQWHPEKVQFEWKSDLAIPHSANAVKANSFMARFLVDRARLNSHRLMDDGMLIYNYSDRIVYTGPAGSSFEQCYVF